MTAHRLTWLVAAVAAVIAPAVPAAAQEAGVPLSDCGALVGVYITQNYNKHPGPKRVVSRSLLTFAADGAVAFDDSAEGGGPGYAPFSGGQGAWTCVAAEDGTLRFRAVVLDFTLASIHWPEPRIGRLDLDGAYDTAAGTMSGSATLSFAPFDADPLDRANLRDGATGPFDAMRITAD
ncbi:MAG: hypothetical protein KDJ88_08820 [Bauldia sp.]|nr:hypothetical protein [Bauldia sp.]